MQRIRFAFLVLPVLTLLSAAAAAEAGGPDPGVAVRDERLEGLRPAISPTPPVSLLTPEPEAAVASAGRLLLHRKGCSRLPRS